MDSLKNQLRNKNFYVMVSGDAVLFAISLLVSYLLRFDLTLPEHEFSQFMSLLPFVVPIKIISFFSFGLYRGMWRYTSVSDIWGLFKATLFSDLIIVSVILYLHHFQGYSRGVFLTDGILTFLLCGGFRLSVRLLYSRGLIFKEKEKNELIEQRKKSIIIVGAGDAGEIALREIINNPLSRYEVVGFVDDEPKKKGRSIHGVSVMGKIDELPHIISRLGIEEILIALPSATGKQMRRVVDICEKCGVPFKTLPGMMELIDGKVSLKNIRDIKYEDLLRRPPVRIELDAISSYLRGKKVLVTGAGGSIGSELCRQIARFEPEEMILLDASEANLYEIQMELGHRLGYKNHTAILGNVQYRPIVEGVMEKHRPDVVIHAAAYKHVPMMELNPWEAIFNNVVGSKNVMRAAVKYRVERFVMVSTDKAVRPVNVMGATKRVCELIMQSLDGENGTKMMCVRFGNVIGSSGSVIPLFKRQIEYGGPVTVTHPEVTRYFMTIPEACQLILQAGSMGDGGEIFILEMGNPVKVVDIAQDLVRLSGKEVGKDVEIVFTGLRPGEKLYEELITEGEGIVRTEHEKIFVLKPEDRWFGHNNRTSFKEWLHGQIEELIEAAKNHNTEQIKRILNRLVPEYRPK